MQVIETNRSLIKKLNLDHTLFSWSKQSGLDPIIADHAEGVYLYDSDGRRYIDFSSQLMNVNIGHGNQRVTRAVVDQMARLSYVYPGAATEARGKLGAKLAAITPNGLQKAFFTLGGAEAIENAIKLARMYTGRQKIITHYRSYHGATYGAISAGGDPRKFPVDNQGAPGFVHVENPYYYRCPWKSSSPEECGERCAENLERVILYQNPENVAAILMEGESGSSGCIKYPPGYLKKVKAIAEKYGILFIADEVMSGFGRTGKWFAVEHHEVEPDMLCMAKGLTCGYIPLGAVMVHQKIASYFDDHPMVIGLTYSAHAVACAAALEVLQIYEDEDLINRAAKRGGYLDGRLCEMMARHPSIGDFRNTGLLGCIELVKNRETREPMAPWNSGPAGMQIMNKVAAKIKELGMFTFVRWNWIFTAPPLIISEGQIDEGLEIISEAISLADPYCS